MNDLERAIQLQETLSEGIPLSALDLCHQAKSHIESFYKERRKLFSELQSETRKVYVSGVYPFIKHEKGREWHFWIYWSKSRFLRKHINDEQPIYQQIGGTHFKLTKNRTVDKRTLTRMVSIPEEKELILRYDERFSIIRKIMHQLVNLYNSSRKTTNELIKTTHEFSQRISTSSY